MAPTEESAVRHGRRKRNPPASPRLVARPFWAKEMPKAAMFKARIESVDTAPAFRDAFKSKRCLVPADGFYEWTISPADKKRDAWHIFQPDRRRSPCRPLGLQFQFRCHELHDHRRASLDPMKQLHDRQPVILDPLRRLARSGDSSRSSKAVARSPPGWPTAVLPGEPRRKCDRQRGEAERQPTHD